MDKAYLVLEDGSHYVGEAFGARGQTLGELVFATGMTGYQETITDPSYAGQIVVQTAPHIGIVGMNERDEESGRIWVAGYVVKEPSRMPSNWRAERTLQDELAEQGVVGIAGVDTRAITLRIPAPQDSKGGIEIGEALYVSTVFSSAPLERVWAHGLGVRGKSRVFASGDGLSIERKGERDLFIPSNSARGITREGATIDKGLEPGGLIAIHWLLGDTEVSTNLRVVGDIRDFIKQIKELTGEQFG